MSLGVFLTSKEELAKHRGVTVMYVRHQLMWENDVMLLLRDTLLGAEHIDGERVWLNNVAKHRADLAVLITFNVLTAGTSIPQPC